MRSSSVGADPEPGDDAAPPLAIVADPLGPAGAAGVPRPRNSTHASTAIAANPATSAAFDRFTHRS
jgi:hypothetical protein